MPAAHDLKSRPFILLLIAIASRAAALGNPIVHVDEAFYLTAADRMLHGAIPFVDLWDRKPVGLFLLYAPAAALPGQLGVWAYQCLALACVVITAELIARLALRAGWTAGATLAAIAYILWLNPLGGVGGQSPVFYNVLVAAAAILIIDPHPSARRMRGMVAMGLLGIALQIKYSVIFEGLFFGMWLLFWEWRANRSRLGLAGYAVALVAVTVLPTVAAFATYAALGHGEAFIYANFTSILARHPDPPLEALGNAAGLTLMLSPLIAMAFGSRGKAVGGKPKERQFLFVWFAMSLFGIGVFGGWFEHYGQPAIVPGAACSAGWLGADHRKGRAASVILLTVALIGQITVVLNRINRGSSAQLAALTERIGRGPGCLYVFSGTSMLYRTTGRCTVTRYLFPSHLGLLRERGAIGVDQAAEVRRIFDQHPETVVMSLPYPGERADIRHLAFEALARDYRKSAVLPLGDGQIAVYRRKG